MTYKLTEVMPLAQVTELAQEMGYKLTGLAKEPNIYKLVGGVVVLHLHDDWGTSTHIEATIALPAINKYYESRQLLSKPTKVLARALLKFIATHITDIERHNRIIDERIQYNQHTRDSVELVCASYPKPHSLSFHDNKAYLVGASGTVECNGLFTRLDNIRLPTKQACKVIQFIESLGDA